MIGPKTIQVVVDSIGGLLRENQSLIDEAYEKMGELALSINAKFGEVGKHGINCAVSLAFVKEKVKAESRFQFDEDQLPIDFGGGVIESITINDTVLNREDARRIASSNRNIGGPF